jgi:ParB-like chromosome segregation protein Spo0J
LSGRRPVSLPPYTLRRVDELVPYAANSRKHAPEQIDHLCRLIREFGFTSPLLIDGERGILAGHARLMAAKKLGMVEVPTLEFAHLSPEQRRALVIADNSAAQGSSWDEDILREELLALEDAGYDVSLTGFDVPADELGADWLDSGEVEDVGTDGRFWISIQGPIERQAEALQAIKALAKIAGVEVDSNLVG